jgi:hypothetical protein
MNFQKIEVFFIIDPFSLYDLPAISENFNAFTPTVTGTPPSPFNKASADLRKAPLQLSFHVESISATSGKHNFYSNGSYILAFSLNFDNFTYISVNVPVELTLPIITSYSPTS